MYTSIKSKITDIKHERIDTSWLTASLSMSKSAMMSSGKITLIRFSSWLVIPGQPRGLNTGPLTGWMLVESYLQTVLTNSMISIK